MHIKHAEIKDLEGLTQCARRFFEYADYAARGTPLDEDCFKEKVAEYIEDPNGIVLLLMDKDRVAGGIAGYVGEWCFNKNIKMAVELFYWVDEEYRGLNSAKLFILYEKYAKACGAVRSVMVSIDTHLKEKVRKLYLRRGYKEYERFYIKTI